MATWYPGAGLELRSRSLERPVSLRFGTYSQLTFNLVHNPAVAATEDTPGAARDVPISLQLRRARVWLTGTVLAPHVHFAVQLGVAPRELGLSDAGISQRSPLLDAMVWFDRLRDATIVVGQYKVPYNHQRLTRVTDLQFVDRTSANDEFSLDRDVGLDVRSHDIAGLGRLRYYAGVYLGDGIARYAYGDLGLAYVVRTEFAPLGFFDDLGEGDHARSTSLRLQLGGAYAFIDRDPHDTHAMFGRVPADGGTTTTHNATGDLTLRLAGLSLEFGFFWRRGRRTPGPTLDPMGLPISASMPRNGVAYTVQLGYLIPRVPLELGVRSGQIWASRAQETSSLGDQGELGGVISYFFARHALKLQLDYLRLWSGTGPRDMGRDQVRLQLQAGF